MINDQGFILITTNISTKDFLMIKNERIEILTYTLNEKNHQIHHNLCKNAGSAHAQKSTRIQHRSTSEK